MIKNIDRLVISKNVLMSKNLNAKEKLIFSGLIAFSNDLNCTTASNKELYKFFNVSEMSIKRALQTLKSLNLIESIKCDGRVRTLKIHPENIKG